MSIQLLRNVSLMVQCKTTATSPTMTFASYIESINSSLPGQMAAILADDNIKCIFLNENYRIPILISLKYVPWCPIDNKSALVQVMACRRRGDNHYLN